MTTSRSLEAADRRASYYLTDSFQQTLASWNRLRLAPGFPEDRNFESEIEMQLEEATFIDELRGAVREQAAEAPVEAEAFIRWFEDLEKAGAGQGDALFPWLADEATADELRWFFEQEAAGEAGFDDLVAYTQVKLPVPAKLELARNYWDEMGRGTQTGMHGLMLDGLVETLSVNPTIEGTVSESLTLANAMTAMATIRSYAWHSIGALGVIELTAPGRSAFVAQGLRRIGLSDRERRYFDLHAVLDIKHSEAWNREALLPLVAEDPRRATAIAEGALIRLECGFRCFERYRRELWVSNDPSRPNMKRCGKR